LEIQSFDIILTLALLAPPTAMCIWLFISKMHKPVLKSVFICVLVTASTYLSYDLASADNRMWRLVIAALIGYLVLLFLVAAFFLVSRFRQKHT